MLLFVVRTLGLQSILLSVSFICLADEESAFIRELEAYANDPRRLACVAKCFELGSQAHPDALENELKNICDSSCQETFNSNMTIKTFDRYMVVFNNSFKRGECTMYAASLRRCAKQKDIEKCMSIMVGLNRGSSDLRYIGCPK